MNERVNKCYSCEFHRQDCTFTLANSAGVSRSSPLPRKRKLEELLDDTSQRYVCFTTTGIVV